MALIIGTRTRRLDISDDRDIIIVPEGSLIAVESTTPVILFQNNVGNADILINGSIIGAGVGIDLGFTSGFNDIVIGKTGQITTIRDGIRITETIRNPRDGGNDIVVEGSITSVNNTGIFVNTDNNEITITGSVFGGINAINAGGTNNQIINSGEVTSSNDGIRAGDEALILNTSLIDAGNNGVDLVGLSNAALENTGSIAGGGTGVVLNFATDVTVSNSGTIDGREIGVSFGGSNGTTIINTGEITSPGTGLQGVLVSGSTSIVNHGLIQGGESFAIDLNGDVSSGENTSNGVVLENTGVITGSVRLTDDGDVYDGTGGGVVNGSIIAGAGDDLFLIGGADDRMIGGPGEDLFFFTTREFGQDTITDFRPGEDTLFFAQSGLGAENLVISQRTNDVLIEADSGSSVLLLNVNINALSDGDFLF